MKAFPREIEPTEMKERHVGIENELRVINEDGGYYDEDEDYCCESCSGSREDEVPYEVEEALSKRGLLQHIGEDGGGREFVTCPIRVKSLKQVKGERYLREYYEFLKPSTEVIDSGGTHIHISILKNDHKNMEANALALTIAFFEQFQQIAGRDSHWADCPAGRNIEEVQAIVENKRYRAGERRYGRSYWMLTPSGHQTLEFRGPRGSNDADEVLAWVDFVEQIVKVANRKSVHGVQFRDLLKGKRIAEYVKSLGFCESDLNKTVNVNALG